MSFEGALSLGEFVIKSNMDFENLVSQFQSRTNKILCVEDGIYLRIYEEYGPFPFGLMFEHKHRRLGMTEYIFRCAMGTDEEKSFCIFGRDNAEAFCPDFVDDQYTSSEEEIVFYESEESSESLYSEIFPSSTSAGSEIPEYSDSDDSLTSYKTDCELNIDNVETQEEKIARDDIHILKISHSQKGNQIQEKIFKI